MNEKITVRLWHIVLYCALLLGMAFGAFFVRNGMVPRASVCTELWSAIPSLETAAMLADDPVATTLITERAEYTRLTYNRLCGGTEHVYRGGS